MLWGTAPSRITGLTGARNNESQRLRLRRNVFDHTKLQNIPLAPSSRWADASGQVLALHLWYPEWRFCPVDNINGSFLGLQKAASKNFECNMGGKPTKPFTTKDDRRATGASNVKPAHAEPGKCHINYPRACGSTVADGQALIRWLTATLTPGPTRLILDGTNSKLTDPCRDLFTSGSSPRAIAGFGFVPFMYRAILFASFTSNGLKQSFRHRYGTGLK